MEAAESLSAVLGGPLAQLPTEPLAEGGVSGSLVRVRLGDGSTVIVKGPAADPVVRDRQRALGMYEREACFYRELAPVVPLRTPRCLFAADEVLVLEDLAPAVAGTFAEGLAVERVGQVVDDFAALHGEWADPEALRAHPWLWRVNEDEAGRWQANLEARLPVFVDRHRDRLSAADVHVAELLTTQLASVMLRAAALPATLCHGDPGPPNLMLTDDRVTYVDWQLAAARSGALDLAWLLVLGVPDELRRDRESQWLERYGVRAGIARAELRDAYDMGVALALRAPIWMGGAPASERTLHVDAYAAATLPRAFAAARQTALSILTA